MPLVRGVARVVLDFGAMAWRQRARLIVEILRGQTATVTVPCDVSTHWRTDDMTIEFSLGDDVN